MAKLIPSRIDDSLKKEMISVLRILKDDETSSNIFVIYSTKKNNDFEMRNDEIIVLSQDRGVFVIKIYDDDISKENHQFKAEDTCYHKIKNYLNNQGMEDVLIGWGMAFSACKMEKKDSNSYSRKQIFNLNDNFSLFISELSDYYFENRDRKNKPNYEVINEIFKLLKPILGLYDSVKQKGEIISLKKEQELLLSELLAKKKVVIHGAAGTGKTELALILAQKCCEKGLKTAYFTNNIAARDKVREVVNEMHFDKSNFICDSFQEYLVSFCKNSGLLPKEENPSKYDKEKRTEFYDYKLRKMVLEALEKNHPDFTVIIMDQAQDNADPEYLFVISLLLRKKMLNGTWYFFGDFLHQLLFRRSVYSSRLKQYLDAFIDADIVDKELSINYRSDRKICDELNNITKTNVVCASPNDGIVQYIEYKDNNEILELDIILDKLVNIQKVSPNNITILGVKNYDDSSIRESSFYNLITNDLSRLDKIHFSTIFKYKGLENSIVVIFDLSSSKKSIDEDENKKYRIQLLYTGISRARNEVYIIQNDYDSKLLQNIKFNIKMNN